MSLYVQNKDVIFRKEEDGAIIFNPDNSDIVAINSTGYIIWQLCDGKHTKEEIANKMFDEFDVTCEDLRKDIDRFICDLEKRNCLKKISNRSQIILDNA